MGDAGHQDGRQAVAGNDSDNNADLVSKKRRRLEARLGKLPKLYSWGDISDEDYRRGTAETRTMLAELPDSNKLVAFDRNRHAW